MQATQAPHHETVFWWKSECRVWVIFQYASDRDRNFIYPDLSLVGISGGSASKSHQTGNACQGQRGCSGNDDADDDEDSKTQSSISDEFEDDVLAL